jgi:hypothetical protein
MAELSDQELREAAAEAGISPHELRHALAQREGVDLVRRDGDGGPASVMGPPARGSSAAHVEGPVARPPAHALAAVRASIERQTGRTGHRQGEHEADVVDDDLGLTYRVRAQDDGAGGALVRIDVDPTSGRSARAVALAGVGGVAFVLLGLGLVFGSTMLVLGAIALGGLGGLWVGRRAAQLGRGLASARAIAGNALMEAEDEAGGAPQGALPPAR